METTGPRRCSELPSAACRFPAAGCVLPTSSTSREGSRFPRPQAIGICSKPIAVSVLSCWSTFNTLGQQIKAATQTGFKDRPHCTNPRPRDPPETLRRHAIKRPPITAVCPSFHALLHIVHRPSLSLTWISEDASHSYPDIVLNWAQRSESHRTFLGEVLSAELKQILCKR